MGRAQSSVIWVNKSCLEQKCNHQLNSGSTQNAFNRHKECNQNRQRVLKVPFNKDLNRNTPPRAVLSGVFCVCADAFKSYDVTKSALVVNNLLFIFFCCHVRICELQRMNKCTSGSYFSHYFQTCILMLNLTSCKTL